jgi:hypothetical protein
VEKDTTVVSVSGGMMDFCLEEDLMDWTAVEAEKDSSMDWIAVSSMSHGRSLC